MHRRISTPLAVFAVIAGLTGWALAAETMGTGAEAKWKEGACKADAEKLCAGVQPGEGRLRDCLKQHEAEVSAECKSNIAMAKTKMKKRMEEITTACKADQEQYCKDVTPGEGREMACLRAYSDKVSEGCKTAMKKQHSMHGMHEGGKKMPEAAPVSK